jgi:hypothetical protein
VVFFRLLKFKWILGVLLLGIFQGALGQALYKITGQVSDAETGEVLAFCRIKLDSTPYGSTSNDEGRFSLQAPPGKYTLVTYFVGYKPIRLPIEIKNKSVDSLQLKLELADMVEEIVITGKAVNPAHRIIRNAIAHRKDNSFEKIDAYEYSAYNKMVISMDKITDEFLNQRLLRKAGTVLNSIKQDSVVKDSGAYKLAVFVSETSTRAYFCKPGQAKEEIQAVKTSGVANSEYNLLNSMVINLNVYENYLVILEKQFMSPIAEGAFSNYDYFIKYIQAEDQDTVWGIEIFPRRPYDKVFKGIIYIDNKDWAVNRLDISMNDNPNINFIEDIRIRQNFFKQDSFWIPSLMDIELNFINGLVKGQNGKGPGLIGRVSSYRYDYKIGFPRNPVFYKQEAVEIEQGAGRLGKDTAFWNKNRIIPLDRSEQLGYALVDSLKSRGFLDFYIKTIRLVTFGVKEFKYFDLGPYFYILGFNQVEGPRTRIGLYSRSELSKYIYAGGHVAYGTWDQRYKYSSYLKFRLNQKPKFELGLSRTYEVEQAGFYDFINNGSSLLATSLRRVPFLQLNYFTENKLFINWDMARGISANVYLRTKLFQPAHTFDFAFQYPETGLFGRNYNITEAGANFRISFKEKYIMRDGNKVYISTPYPIFQLFMAYGRPGLFNGDFEYRKFNLNISDKVRMGRFGFSNVSVNFGKVWGTLPYPSLYVFQGNQTWGFDAKGFNLMNYLEFVADEYATLSLNHHLEGWIWNKFPALRKLKFKEVITARLAYGRINEKNQIFNLSDTQRVQAPSQEPYMEAGMGIENILKVLRIDAVWRLNYHVPTATNFGIRFYLALQF